MFDTHCHLYSDQFDEDRYEIVKSLAPNNINHILIPGIDVISSNRSIQLSTKYPDLILSAVGIHPNYSGEVESDSIYDLVQEERPNICAIGEIGLDFYRDYASREVQILTFERMLDIAQEFALPICLHNRDAEDDLIEILDKWYCQSDNSSSHTGVFHAYNGKKKIASWGIENGFLFGIGGYVTYKKAEQLRKMILEIGLKNLVLETDSPYLAPVPYRGRRNSPLHLGLIAQSVAEIFNCSIEEVIHVTDHNASKMFDIK